MPGFWETLKNNPALWSAPTLNRAYEDQQMLSAYENKLKIAQKLEEEAAKRIESRRVLDRASGEWIVLNRFGEEIRKERATPDEIAMQAATVGKAGSEANRAESEATRAKEMLPGGKIWGEEQKVRDANIKQSNASTAAAYSNIKRDNEAMSDANRVEDDAITLEVSKAKALAKEWASSPDVQGAVSKLDMDYAKYRTLDPASPAAQVLRREILGSAQEIGTLALQKKDREAWSARGALGNPYGMPATMEPANPGFNPKE